MSSTFNPSKVPFDKIPSPCFLLDEQLLINNLEKLKDVSDRSGGKIILALKGFSMFSTFDLVKKYLPGTTASSLNEARLAYEEFGGEVHAYCVAYPEPEFAQIIQYSNHITFNSLSQFELLYPKVVQSGKQISCGLRINPEYSETETDLYNPCIPGSRLGATADKFGDNLPAGIEGLHFHNLCEKDSYALERTIRAVEARFGHLLHQCKWINFGGGHAITRKDYDREHLITLIREIKNKYNAEVILEPGSAVAWETGWLVSTVLDIVENGGVKAVILDASISAHLPDCIEMPYKPVILNAEDATAGKQAYRMGGLTCLAGDYVGDYAFDTALVTGSKVIFNDMIHYTMVKTSTFNGVNLPNIGIWTKEGTYRHVKSFGYEDYKSRLS